MLEKKYPYYLAGKAEMPNTDLVVYDKYTGKEACRTALADDETLDRAADAAVAAAEEMGRMPAHRRKAVLDHCVRRFTERAEELAQALCIEAGKPIRDSRGEVTRLIETFAVAAEESVRIQGEYLPLDRSARTEGYRAVWQRVPVGPCSFISPFNFPLNLAAHKVAPALAVGCPFVLKPASFTPVGALLIGETLAETDLPEGAFSILPCPRDRAARLVEDERFKLLSFTGSQDVGWTLKARAGKKKVVLELGGNAACIVDADADLEDAVTRIVIGAFYQSGQSCISIQRIIVHEVIYEEFKERLVEAAGRLKAGDPRREDTFLGPLIAETEAERLEKWIQSARDKGARLLCGGGRKGALMEATLIEGVPRDEPLYHREAFGPVALLSTFRRFEEAVEEANHSRYGLQAGVFTRDLHKALLAWDRLDVGGVVIGDIPSWRADQMPYGGVKDSGFGREGLRWSMEEMTEMRLMVIRERPA